MNYVGIDLHKRFLVVAAEDAEGRPQRPVRLVCEDAAAIRRCFQALKPFRAVIEASSSYRWLFELIAADGDVVLAHPYRLRAIVSGRAKTDKLDAALLARLLRGGLIPAAYVPPRPYYELRELARGRARLSRRMTEAKNELHALLGRANVQVPFRNAFCKRGRTWIGRIDLGQAGNVVRDELLRRVEYYTRERDALDQQLAVIGDAFPEQAALTALHGVGRYAALLIIAELGEPTRFHDARAVGAYAGLTPRVSQSGARCRHGHITRQGSPWLRWILGQVSMQFVRRDPAARNFYTRIRKRSSAGIARVATARKLAAICWVRLMQWHQLQPA